MIMKEQNNTTMKLLNQNKMKQTAVEWLENEFKEICKDFGGLHTDFIVKFDQAKEIDKEQKNQMYNETEVLQLLLKLHQTEFFDNLYDWFNQNKKTT